MGAPVMQPARHAAAPALRNAARAHTSLQMVLTPGADGTPPRNRPKGSAPYGSAPCRDPSPRARPLWCKVLGMDRRVFLGSLAGLLAVPLAAEAQGRLQMCPGSDPVHVHSSDSRGRSAKRPCQLALRVDRPGGRARALTNGTSESIKGYPNSSWLEHERRVNRPVDLVTETASTG
jgi:hypothetical protein